jgi:hypothetical protein
VGCLNAEEFTRPGADHTEHVHAKMVAVFRASGPTASFVPSPAWSRITLKTRFIREPKVYLLLGVHFAKTIPEGLAHLLVLTIRPRLGYLEGIALFMKESHHRLIAALNGIALTNMAMKGLCRPEVPVGLLGVVDQVGKEHRVLFPYEVRTSRPLIGDQPVHPAVIEPADPATEAPFSNLQCSTPLFPRDTHDEHLHGMAP